MSIEEQNIILERFINNVSMICEMNTNISLVAELTIDYIEEGNANLGKLFYNSEYYQYRLLEEVIFNDIKLI